jgi:hypothetical protein
MLAFRGIASDFDTFCHTKFRAKLTQPEYISNQGGLPLQSSFRHEVERIPNLGLRKLALVAKNSWVSVNLSHNSARANSQDKV